MGRMKCKCGAAMVDVQIPNSYVGNVVSDADMDHVYESIATELALLIEATSNEQSRLGWIEKHFEVPPYPADASNYEIITDLISQINNRCSRSLWQCENCGRLWLQDKPYENTYRSFNPDEEWNGKSSLESLRTGVEP